MHNGNSYLMDHSLENLRYESDNACYELAVSLYLK